MLVSLTDYAKYAIKTPFDYNVIFYMETTNIFDTDYRVFYATSVSASPLLGEDFTTC